MRRCVSVAKRSKSAASTHSPRRRAAHGAAMDTWTILLAFLVVVVVRVLWQWLEMLRLTRDGMPSALPSDTLQLTPSLTPRILGIFPIPLFGVNVFKLLPHVKELHVPVFQDIIRYGLIHRAWYYKHQMIVVTDPEELSNVRFLRRNCWAHDASYSARTSKLSTARSTNARVLAYVALHSWLRCSYGQELLGGGMLLVQNGENWKRARGICMPRPRCAPSLSLLTQRLPQ